MEKEAAGLCIFANVYTFRKSSIAGGNLFKTLVLAAYRKTQTRIATEREGNKVILGS